MMACRCCSIPKANLKDIYEFSIGDDGSKSTLANKLEIITGIKINKDDLSPKTICFQCKLLLEMSFEFQKMTKKNELLYAENDQVLETTIQDHEMFEEEEFLEEQLCKYIPDPAEQEESTKDTKDMCCEIGDCNKVFHTKVALNMHIKVKHKVKPPVKRVSVSPRKTEVPEKINKGDVKLVCLICHKDFHTQQAMTLHMKLKHKK